ncbi:uncharacterized protein [Argopecten irradians]|uniref:uncharacterized protein n=1 Tax=Argopecten irradians TaxID=31199 RepID=UPI003717E8F6
MSIGKKASLREDIISLKVEMLDLNPKMSKENVFKLMKDVITWEENDIELMLKESELKQNRSMESRTRLAVKVAEMEERVIVLKEKLLSLEQNMSRTNRKEMVREVLESREGVIGLKECIIERKLEQIYLKSDLPWETQAHLMEEVKALKEDVLYKKLELIRLTPHTSKKCVRMLEEVKVMQEELVRIKNKVQIMENNALKIEAILCRHFHALMVAVVAYLMFCAVVTKSVFQKQCLMKHSFVLAALFILWTSGDVEKHPGPWSILVFASIRALLTRLVKHLQGTAVANWGIEPPFWNRNIVFKDINKIKDSDNAEKYAMFYAALQATITKFGRFPDWCREEMVFVETGNEVELQKCQTARKVRELLKPYQGQDVDDILRRAGLPRQTGNPSLSAAASPTQPSSSTVVRHQRPQKCPYNVPGYRPITEITDAATAGLIAEGCMAQSKNAGNIRSKPSNKRQATTSAVAPAPKQQRLTTNQIPTATVSPSSQPGQSGIVSHTLAFIIPAQALTVTASPSDVSVHGVQTTSRRVPVTSTIVRPPATISLANAMSPPQSTSVSMATCHHLNTMQASNNNFTASSVALPSPSTSGSQPFNLTPGVQTASRSVHVNSTIVRLPATIATTSQASVTSTPQSTSVSMATGHQVITMHMPNNSIATNSAVLPIPSTSGRQTLNLFPGVTTSTTGMSTTTTTNLRSASQPINIDTTQQGTMQQSSNDSSTNSSTTPSGPSPFGRPRANPVSLPSDDLEDLDLPVEDLDLPVDFNLEEFAIQIMKDDKK